MLRLLCTAALRRAEMCALDVSDFDAAEGTLLVLGKGKSQRKAITLPPGCIDALRSYLTAARHGDGPLFRNVARHYTLAGPARAAGRLTPDGLYKIVSDYGEKLGLRLTPHKLRHSAIRSSWTAVAATSWKRKGCPVTRTFGRFRSMMTTGMTGAAKRLRRWMNCSRTEIRFS